MHDNEHQKMMVDLHRLIETKDFKTKAELIKFMDSMIGQKVPSFPKETLSFKEQAQDLVFEAHELSLPQGRPLIKKALKLDPDCIEAYEYLATREQFFEIAIPLYKTAISIGDRLFGGDYLKEFSGKFWGLNETRPYMRCLQQYADCLFAAKKIKECSEILERMLELNPNDNQGVRDNLFLCLIALNEKEKYEKYSKMFKGETSAFTVFNDALFSFKIEGETTSSDKKIKKAIKTNKFVLEKLASNQPIKTLPGHYGIGDNNEAVYYAHFAKSVWKSTDGALTWLSKYA